MSSIKDFIQPNGNAERNIPGEEFTVGGLFHLAPGVLAGLFHSASPSPVPDSTPQSTVDHPVFQGPGMGMAGAGPSNATVVGGGTGGAEGLRRLPPIMQVEKQQVTTSATQMASASRRRNEAHFICPVPGCGSTFTRRFNLRGGSPLLFCLSSYC